MNSSGLESTCDVIIVGGGPSGLLTGIEALRGGASVLLVDDGLAVDGARRSLGLHWPTVEMLRSKNLLREILGDGRVPGSGTEFRGGFAVLHFERDRKKSKRGDITGVATTWRDLCASLETEFVRRGGQRIRGHVTSADLVTGRQDRISVRVSGRREEILGHYIVGADGGSSIVRQHSGIGLDVTSPRMMWRQAVGLPASRGLDLTPGWHRFERGWVAVMPHERYLTVELLRTRDATSLSDEELFTQSYERIVGRPARFESVTASSVFTDSSKLASSYVRGRFVLVGDAAHTHVPLGGQGVNLGLGDAVNLGWKLALACTLDKGDALLRTYDEERRPVAQAVLENTAAQIALMFPGSATDALRGLLQQHLDSSAEARLFFGQLLDGSGTRYVWHDEQVALEGMPMPTDAMSEQLREEIRSDSNLGLFTWLTANDEPNSKTALIVKSSKVRHRMWGRMAPCQDSFLVRPDGIVLLHEAFGVDPKQHALRPHVLTHLGLIGSHPAP